MPTMDKLITVYHAHPFNGPLSRTTRMSRCQKGKTNLDFAEARYCIPANINKKITKARM